MHPRWYHDFLAVKAEVATDRQEIAETRETAEFYLTLDVADSEAVKKLGTLHPLVRAEVEAALAQDRNLSTTDGRGAREALAIMRQIRDDFPAPSSGSYMAETHDTHLTFATAEVSRLDGSDPVLWQQALEEADYIYYRLYAQIRLGEALVADGRADDGRQEIEAALSESEQIGAARLTELARGLLSG